MPRPKTHDEALRRRLLEAAASLLTTWGPDALSVRRVAHEVETSTTAVYSLFGGKPELLRAVFYEALARFEAHLDAVAPSTDPVADILALGRAYRASALGDPHLYKIIFGSPVPGFEPQSQDWQDGARATLGRLLDAVARGVHVGAFHGTEPDVIATALWAGVHGFVSLELAGALPVEPESANLHFEAAMTAHVRGWTRHNSDTDDGNV